MLPYSSVHFTLFCLVFCSSCRSYTQLILLLQWYEIEICELTMPIHTSPSTLACPYCPLYFNTKSGCTRHIQAKHPADGSEPHAPNTAACPSPVPSSPQPSFHDMSLVLSDFTLPFLPPSHDDMDIEHSHSDQDYNLPEGGEEVNGSFPPEGNPDAFQLTHAFHPKLDGTSIFCYIYIEINFVICRADL